MPQDAQRRMIELKYVLTGGLVHGANPWHTALREFAMGRCTIWRTRVEKPADHMLRGNQKWKLPRDTEDLLTLSSQSRATCSGTD